MGNDCLPARCPVLECTPTSGHHSYGGSLLHPSGSNPLGETHDSLDPQFAEILGAVFGALGMTTSPVRAVHACVCIASTKTIGQGGFGRVPAASVDFPASSIEGRRCVL